jgi:hypothetical protein
MNNKKRKTRSSESMVTIFNLIFEQVFPVWRQYEGDVPQPELERLDREGDFPRGVTAKAVARLNHDKSLQKQCERLFR